MTPSSDLGEQIRSRNIVVFGVALVTVFLALEWFTWWIPDWFPAYSAGSTFATTIAWLLLLNIVTFAVVGLLLTMMLRGSFAGWLAMVFGLSYGAARLILYSFGLLPSAPFWLHPFVLAAVGISPLIGTALAVLAFRRLNRNQTHAA